MTLRDRPWSSCMKRTAAFLVTSTSLPLRTLRMRPTSLLLIKSAKVLFTCYTHKTELAPEFMYISALLKFMICVSIYPLITGLTVVIRCPDSNNTNSTTGGTALPKFAIRGMLKTFGLHGVVLDVDSVSKKNLIFVCV